MPLNGTKIPDASIGDFLFMMAINTDAFWED